MNDLKFHHIGVATKSIEKELQFFLKLGYQQISDVFCDETQKIKGVFIAAPFAPTLELLENLDETGPLSGVLEKGIKFYHFAYETQDIETDLKKLVDSGAIVVRPIVNATFFEKICFCMLRNMMMIELVQKKN